MGRATLCRRGGAGLELVDLGLETGECGVSGLIEQGWPLLVLCDFTDTFI
jgi:hypothetical protein